MIFMDLEELVTQKEILTMGNQVYLRVMLMFLFREYGPRDWTLKEKQH